MALRVGGASELARLAERFAAAPGDTEARVLAFRAEVRARWPERVPAAHRNDYVSALLQVAGATPAAGVVALRASADAAERASDVLDGSIGETREVITTLERQLDALSADNVARHEACRAAFTAVRERLVSVFTDRRVHEDDRVSAFFRIHAGNQQQAQLDRAWRAYEAKQGELRDQLANLRAAEVELAPDRGEGDLLALFVLRVSSLERVLRNLEEQAELLRKLVGHASGMNAGLAGVQAALDRELAQCNAWIAGLRERSVSHLLAYAAGLAGFAASLAGAPAAAIELVSLLQAVLLEDVDGLREEAEALVWRTLGRLITAGAIDAGASDPIARALVGGIRAVARAGADERAGAAALVTAGARAALGEGQRLMIDFLLREASDLLPLVSLVRSTLALPGLTRRESEEIIGALRTPHASGLDTALAALVAAADGAA